MKPISSELLVNEVKQARQTWDDSFAGLNDADFENAEISPHWTLKDVLAHLTTYLDLNVRHLRAYRKRKTLASMRARNWYQFNKREAARQKKTPLSKIRADFERAYNELIDEMSGLTDDDLKASFPSPWSQNETRKVRLATVLRADVSNHFKEHARAVEKWRASINKEETQEHG